MIVDVDIGNTFIKWRVDGEQAVARQATASLVNGWDAALDSIQRVRIASVAGVELTDRFCALVRSRYSVESELARVTSGVGGVVPSYPDLSRLGVDRWLAMLAAYQQQKSACLVINAGSAFTADWLDDSGLHLGGLIAPGRQKMLDALYYGVANVLAAPLEQDVVQEGQPLLDLGSNTQECVLAGVNTSMAGFFTLASLKHPAMPIYLAGGDALAMLSLCAQEHKIRVKLIPDLVLDGLAIALP